MNSRSTLVDLYRTAEQACERGYSTSDFEAEFAAVLDYIRANPQSRADASLLFIDAIEGRHGSWELVEYCMHELRRVDVLEAARTRLVATDDWRVKTTLSHVVRAFDPDWPDVDLYRRWSTDGPRE